MRRPRLPRRVCSCGPRRAVSERSAPGLSAAPPRGRPRGSKASPLPPLPRRRVTARAARPPSQVRSSGRAGGEGTGTGRRNGRPLCRENARPAEHTGLMADCTDWTGTARAAAHPPHRAVMEGRPESVPWSVGGAGCGAWRERVGDGGGKMCGKSTWVSVCVKRGLMLLGFPGLPLRSLYRQQHLVALCAASCGRNS